MRRILENYFKILGNINILAIIDKFEGHEKIQCQSLISWVNDGSHYSPDELYVAISDAMAQSYMRIFYKVFKVMDHMPHYKMMMGQDFVDLDPVEEVADEDDSIGEAAGNTAGAAEVVINRDEIGNQKALAPLGSFFDSMESPAAQPTMPIAE